MASAALAALLFERFGPWMACFYGSAVLAVVAAGLIFGLKLNGRTDQGADGRAGDVQAVSAPLV